MKKNTIILFVALISLSILSSCNQLDKYTQKDLDYSTEFTIPSPLEENKEYTIESEKIEPNLDNELKKYSSSIDLIEQLNIKEAILTIKDDDTKTFAFLKNVNLFIKADNVGRKKIASKTIEAGKATGTIEMDIEKKLDLTEYLKQESISIEIVGTTNEAVTKDINIKADLKYFVDFKILGN